MEDRYFRDFMLTTVQFYLSGRYRPGGGVTSELYGNESSNRARVPCFAIFIRDIRMFVMSYDTFAILEDHRPAEIKFHHLLFFSSYIVKCHQIYTLIG